MKKIVVFVAFICSFAAIGQNASAVDLEEKKMKQALLYGDKEVATGAMYDIIAIEGPASTYKDSLAYLYFNKRNFLSCFLVTKDVLERNPSNLEMLEMSAISLESIGAKDGALESYQKLLVQSKRAFHGYKIAGLQYEMKKFDEAYTSIKNADQLPDESVIKVSFKVNANYSQDVNLKASIAYLEGIIAIALEKKTEAKIAFERAEKLFPGFVLAKSELDKLNQE